jgi:hypothetical protein
MAIKKYIATKDNTITNVFFDGFSTRATGSNSGRADVLETFSLFGRATTSSVELSRVLVDFPISTIAADRTAGNIPDSGSVEFILKMNNAESVFTLPKNFDLVVKPVSSSWEEGIGIDLETRKDLTSNNQGSNWVRASKAAAWASTGGDYLTASNFTQTFVDGNEDLEVNISSLVEKWLSNTYSRNGVGVFLASTFEASSSANRSGSTVSYATKRFFGRTSEFFFKRPRIEARWNDSKKDDRGNFFLSSSLASAADNKNTLYLYNYIRGRLSNIPAIGTGPIYVDLYQTLGGTRLTQAITTPATGGFVSTGIYSCSVCISGTYSTLRDVWYSGSVQYFTGSITPKSHAASTNVDTSIKLVSLSNLRSAYMQDEAPVIRVSVTNKTKNPTIYTVATSNNSSIIEEDIIYKVVRSYDNIEAIPYGSGSTRFTELSYDNSGSYFTLDCKQLEPGFEYQLFFSLYDSYSQTWDEYQKSFKFRVKSRDEV